MGIYNYIDHPADIAISVEADSLTDLFETAFYAFKEIVIECQNNTITNSINVHLTSNNIDELLITFLNEINYLVQVKKYIVKSIDIEALNKIEIRCIINYEEFDSSIHLIKEEIKAVTYHKLNLLIRNNDYSIVIVLDI